MRQKGKKIVTDLCGIPYLIQLQNNFIYCMKQEAGDSKIASLIKSKKKILEKNIDTQQKKNVERMLLYDEEETTKKIYSPNQQSKQMLQSSEVYTFAEPMTQTKKNKHLSELERSSIILSDQNVRLMMKLRKFYKVVMARAIKAQSSIKQSKMQQAEKQIEKIIDFLKKNQQQNIDEQDNQKELLKLKTQLKNVQNDNKNLQQQIYRQKIENNQFKKHLHACLEEYPKWFTNTLIFQPQNFNLKALSQDLAILNCQINPVLLLPTESYRDSLLIQQDKSKHSRQIESKKPKDIESDITPNRVLSYNQKNNKIDKNTKIIGYLDSLRLSLFHLKSQLSQSLNSLKWQQAKQIQFLVQHLQKKNKKMSESEYLTLLLLQAQQLQRPRNISKSTENYR